MFFDERVFKVAYNFCIAFDALSQKYSCNLYSSLVFFMGGDELFIDSCRCIAAYVHHVSYQNIVCVVNACIESRLEDLDRVNEQSQVVMIDR